MKVLLIDGPSEGRIVDVAHSVGSSTVMIIDPVEFMVNPPVIMDSPARTVYTIDKIVLFRMTIYVGYSCSQSELDSNAIKYFLRPEAIGRIAEL